MKLTKNTSFALMVIIIALLVSVVQSLIWTEAGKSKQSKVYEYEFQLDHWNEEIPPSVRIVAMLT